MLNSYLQTTNKNGGHRKVLKHDSKRCSFFQVGCDSLRQNCRRDLHDAIRVLEIA